MAHFQPEVHFQKALQPPIFVEKWSYTAQNVHQEYGFPISFIKSFDFVYPPFYLILIKNVRFLGHF